MSSMRSGRWIGFAVLCALAASSWVIPQNSPSVLPSLEEQGILFFLIGFVALPISLRGGWRKQRLSDYWRVAVGGLGFFGVPLVVAEYAGGSVPATTRSALFALTPVVVVIVVAARDVTVEERGARRLLMPALIGAGGLLLLLPLEISGSLRGRLMVGLVGVAVVLVGVTSVWLYRLLGEIGWVEGIALLGLTNALFLLVCSGFLERMVWRWMDLRSVGSISFLVDGIEVLLIIWLLRGMAPVRFSARYLVIPLLTVLESFVVERPDVTVRIVCGTALLAVGAGALLFWKARDEEAVLSLR
jgi:drug/metabolite transporter (DMT)-like permease